MAKTDTHDARATQSKRRRNLTATKADLLDAALSAFSERGYDGVSAREIALDVGVNPMLVSRYFGTKEQLFTAAADVAFSADDRFSALFGAERAELGKRLAEFIVRKRAAPKKGPDALSLMIRAAPNPNAAAILRSAIARHFEEGLADTLSGGDHARERAGLLLSLIAGFQTMDGLIGLDRLSQADESFLTDVLGRMFQAAIS